MLVSYRIRLGGPMYQYDATGANAHVIPLSAPAVAGYVTGTNGVKWTQEQFDRWAHADIQYIDQGIGEPFRTPTVIDVETGAHQPSDLPALVAKYGPNLIAYCMQSNLAAVHAVFKGRIWLAAPSFPSDVAALGLAATVRRNFP